MKVLLMAIGFCLVFEGLFPMISPGGWKKSVEEIARIPSEKIRLIGLGSVLLGLLIVWSISFLQ